jgi:hypothetical protein
MMLLYLQVGAQSVPSEQLPKTVIPAVVQDTLRPVIKEVLRPGYLATLEQQDTIPTPTKAGPGLPVPKKSAIFSLILPSAGQIYNRDYWKLPLVYAGFGGAGYMIYWNTVRYNDFLKPYLSSVDANGNPLNKETYEVYIRSDKEIRSLSLDQIKRGKTFYRRYREYGFVVLAVVYALTAVEANVAAHLKNFNANMNEDLTFRIEPSTERTFMAQTAPGVKFVIGF